MAPVEQVVPLPRQRPGNGQGKGEQDWVSLAYVPAPLAQEQTRRALRGTMPVAGWLHCHPTLKWQVMGSQPVTLVPPMRQPPSHVSGTPSALFWRKPKPHGGGGEGGGGDGGGG